MGLDTPSLVFALAMAVGMVGQVLARHARMPGIVVLLALGVLLGPDFADLIRPQAMGSGLNAVVGVAVAIILFEGGLHMRLGVLRKQAVPIRRLVTIGAVVTTVGGMLAAKLIMGWSWELSLLFGTLVIVTGPTVITPLLRRFRVKESVSTILEAEGIFIDAVGATIAVVVLELVISQSNPAIDGTLGIARRLGIGAAIGISGGLVLAQLLRIRPIIPDGLVNIFVLGWAVAIFEISDAIEHESGITAAILAGMAVGNFGKNAVGELIHFKEQLTTLVIATLFVLLSASVRMSDVEALGLAGVGTVFALMFIVRPLTVLASTYGTDLSRNEKIFLSWLAPRGIVAAAVAAIFALELGSHGTPGGLQLQALVFLVIAMTVTLQGLSGGIVASALKLRLEKAGYLIVGANGLAREFAGVLQSLNKSVTLVDSNEEAVRRARSREFTVVEGNALEDTILKELAPSGHEVCIALTSNESVNHLFAQKVLREHKGPEVFVALETFTAGVTEDMVIRGGARALFHRESPLTRWIASANLDEVTLEKWDYHGGDSLFIRDLEDAPEASLLPMLHMRKNDVLPVDTALRLKRADTIVFAINDELREAAHIWLEKSGWRPWADVQRSVNDGYRATAHGPTEGTTTTSEASDQNEQPA